MMSIKDYAEKNNVSYEAIRKQVVRYKYELEGHIKKKNRTQFLDDYAVRFLDEHRQSNPVIVMNTEKDNDLKKLEDEKHNLLIKVAEQADKIAELAEWKANHVALLAESNTQIKMLEQKQEDFEKLKRENEELKEDLLKEKNKTFFQKLFGK